MARNFVTASSQMIEHTAAIITALPVSMACWTRPAGSGNRHLLSFNTNGAATHRLNLGIDNTNLPFVVSRDGGSAVSTSHTTTLANGTWGHLGALFTSTTSRNVYLNGVASSTGTGSSNPSGWDRTTIGRMTSVTANYYEGDVAEVAYWDVALTTAEFVMLAAGYCPLFVRPASLIAYLPLIGRASPEIEAIQALSFTLTNTPANAAHCRQIYPYSDVSASVGLLGGSRIIGERFALVGHGGLAA